MQRTCNFLNFLKESNNLRSFTIFSLKNWFFRKYKGFFFVLYFQFRSYILETYQLINLYKTDIKTDRKTDKKIDRKTDRKTDKKTVRKTDKKTDRKTGRKTDKKTDKKTDRKTNRQ